MDFKSLLSKINELDNSPEYPKESPEDQPVESIADTGLETDQPLHDSEVEECGMSPMSSMSSPAPKQPDNVSMNVNMSGQGAGGIRDLMAILKNIEQGGQDKDMVIGVGEADADGGFAASTTQPTPATTPVDAVLPTGDDLHSKGKEAEKVNGGGNPFNVDESLVSRLSELYTEVKSR